MRGDSNREAVVKNKWPVRVTAVAEVLATAKKAAVVPPAHLKSADSLPSPKPPGAVVAKAKKVRKANPARPDLLMHLKPPLVQLVANCKNREPFRSATQLPP